MSLHWNTPERDCEERDASGFRRLLILSCSQRKSPQSARVPAWDLYDGVVYRVAKRAEREGRLSSDIDIVIISAKYGIVTPHQLIEPYDLRMTGPIAESLAPSNCSMLHDVVRDNQYSEVMVVAGKCYVQSLQPVDNWLPSQVTLSLAEGGIGRKCAILKAWLEAKPREIVDDAAVSRQP